MSNQTKVSELKAGPQLDALVALAQGWKRYGYVQWSIPSTEERPVGSVRQPNLVSEYQPSTNRVQWAELIEEFKIHLDPPILNQGWEAFSAKALSMYRQQGSTPAEAICKAVVASKWGDTIPDEIMDSLK